MSEIRIALVAEGPTDYELINAALRAILPEAFRMTLLQPEPRLPKMGSGWAGVLKWCREAGERHNGPLDGDATLQLYDLVIIHLDVDVALKRYDDCGSTLAVQALEQGWARLPCHAPCPPARETCQNLECVLNSWLFPATPSTTTLWCLPAQSSGAWLAAAVLPQDHALCQAIECDPTVEDKLARLPLAIRIKKTVPQYRNKADLVRANWDQVKRLCPQAAAFEMAVWEALKFP